MKSIPLRTVRVFVRHFFCAVTRKYFTMASESFLSVATTEGSTSVSVRIVCDQNVFMAAGKRILVGEFI